jgi:hypothetical protein
MGKQHINLSRLAPPLQYQTGQAGIEYGAWVLMTGQMYWSSGVSKDAKRVN